MKCPACSNQLQKKTVEDITVDVCDGGCGGIWFDNFEIKKFDEPHESAGQALLDVQKDDSIKIDPEKRLNCPKCENMVMMRHFFSVKRAVLVDECPNCAGFWLDAGELGKIRSLFDTEEQKNQAANDYFSEVFGPAVAAGRAEDAKKLEAARKVSNMFRFICPSNYIPGKQSWGAF